MTVVEAGRALGVSTSTVWRMIRRGDLASLRHGGRRLVLEQALSTGARRRRGGEVPPFTREHPMFRLVGAGHGGGHAPGARDKHAILDR
jgi:excisionase family DNA binding protein